MRQAESGQNQIGPLRSPAGKDRACDKACEQLEGAGWDRKGTGKFLTGYSQAIKSRRHMRLSITQYNVCHMEWRSVGVSGGSDCWLATGFALPVERQQILKKTGPSFLGPRNPRLRFDAPKTQTVLAELGLRAPRC